MATRKGLYRDNGITPNTKCKGCGEKAKDIVKNYPEQDGYLEDSRYSEKLGGWVCHPCIESNEYHPQGTVVVYNPNGARVDKYVVMDHEDTHFSARDVDDPDNLNESAFDIDDEADSPIQFRYHRTDGWRGYYEAEADGWTHVMDDCILAWSDDEAELAKFDGEMKAKLWELGVEFAIVFGTTSNLFSTGYDLYVKKGGDDIKTLGAILVVNNLKLKYRDPQRFRVTALTGGYDKDDKKGPLLAEAYERLQKGEDFESVKTDILEKAKGAE